MRLATRSGDARLEAACQRALPRQSYSSRSVQSILTHGLDQQPLPARDTEPAVIEHINIRGARYYGGTDPTEVAPC